MQIFQCEGKFSAIYVLNGYRFSIIVGSHTWVFSKFYSRFCYLIFKLSQWTNAMTYNLTGIPCYYSVNDWTKLKKSGQWGLKIQFPMKKFNDESKVKGVVNKDSKFLFITLLNIDTQFPVNFIRNLFRIFFKNFIVYTPSAFNLSRIDLCIAAFQHFYWWVIVFVNQISVQI